MTSRMGEDIKLALALEGRVEAAQPEVRSLVALAHALAELPEPEIDAAFADGLEQLLMTDGLAPQPVGKPQLTVVRPAETPDDVPDSIRRAPVVQMPRRRYVVRRGIAAMTAAASLAAFPAVAAAKSLPGSPFYGLKQKAHEVRLAMFGGPVEDAFTLMRYGQEHVAEAAQLAAFPTPDHDLIAQTLDSAANKMDRARSLILDNTRDAAVLTKFADMARDTSADVAAIADGLPGGDAKDAAGGVLAVTERIEQAIAQALGLIPAPAIATDTAAVPAAAVNVPVTGATTTTGSTADSGSGSTATRDKESPNRSSDTPTETTKKPIRDAADGGCQTIGEAQLGSTLEGGSQKVCDAARVISRL